MMYEASATELLDISYSGTTSLTYLSFDMVHLCTISAMFSFCLMILYCFGSFRSCNTSNKAAATKTLLEVLEN